MKKMKRSPLGRRRSSFGGLADPTGLIGGLSSQRGIATLLTGTPRTGHSALGDALYTPHTPENEQKTASGMTNMLRCPSYARCDKALGKNVFVHDGAWPAFKDAKYVVKVFEDDDKLQAEIGAYTVLRKFYTVNKKHAIPEPLRFELVTFPHTDVPHLRIERYVPLREIKFDDLERIPKWAFHDQMSRMHRSGIAHGALSDGSIGHIAEGRFAVTGSHQVVSPLSDFAEVHGGIGGLEQEEARVAAILKPLLMRRGQLLRRIEINGPIDGIVGPTATKAAAAVAQRHNAFVDAAANDANVLSELLGIDIKVTVLKPLDLSKPEAPRAPPPRVCPECDERIAGGIHGSVYTHAKLQDKVMKVFKLTDNADIEVRAYGVMNLVTASDPSFRSLRAKLLDWAPARIEIDKFKTTMRTYIGADDANRDKREQERERDERKQARERDGIGKAHFAGLLDQLRILHSHGVSHGDLHGNNIGFIDSGFVIGDPTWLTVSPLSVLYEARYGPVTPEDQPVLDALRRLTKQGGSGGPREPAYRYVLTEPITELREERSLTFIKLHNNVVEQMQKDKAKLLREFRGLEDDPEWSFVFEGLAPR